MYDDPPIDDMLLLAVSIATPAALAARFGFWLRFIGGAVLFVMISVVMSDEPRAECSRRWLEYRSLNSSR